MARSDDRPSLAETSKTLSRLLDKLAGPEGGQWLRGLQAFLGSGPGGRGLTDRDEDEEDEEGEADEGDDDDEKDDEEDDEEERKPRKRR